MPNDQTETNDANWFFYLIYGFQLLMVLALAFGLWTLYNDINFARKAVGVKAEIIAIDYSTSSSGLPYSNSSTTTFPTFSFRDSNGNKQIVRTRISMNGSFKVGDQLQILHLPDSPSSGVTLQNWRWYKGFGMLIIAASLPFVLMFGWSLLPKQRQQHNKRQEKNRKAREYRAKKRHEKQAAKK